MMKAFFLAMVLVGLVVCSSAEASQPVVTDSRIKTFVYNENDVYNLYTQYGYQTNIEFGPDEEIVTISVGDRIAWQIVPVGRRLFIRPMEEHASTNMTVVTTEHAYQFDLSSSGSGKPKPTETLAYVVRFYYPEEDERLRMAPPVDAAEMVMASVPPVEQYNYRYTFAGPDQLAPLKVYDNGEETYLRFQPAVIDMKPRVYAVGPDGKEYPVRVYMAEAGVLMVDAVVPKLALRYGSKDVVYVYNEGI